MQSIRIGAHTVKVYDGIEDLPILRYHKFNKCLLVDAGIGADIAAVDRHLFKAHTYINANKADLARLELENMRQNINFIINNITPKTLAFAALVAEIDGQPQTDVTDAAIQNVAKMLQDATVKEIDTATEGEKKKIDAELKMMFADIFNDDADKEYFDLLKARTLMVLKGIADGEDDTKRIEELTTQLMLHVKPKPFNGKDNAELRYDKNFEKLCIVLSEYTNANVKRLTVAEFYALLEYAKEKVAEQKKQLKK